MTDKNEYETQVETEESQDDSVNKEAEGESNANEDNTEADQGAGKPADPKEQNRKGYELRKAKTQEKAVSREELDSLKSELQAMKAEKADTAWRAANPHVNDEEFNQIKSFAESSGKTYEEVVGMPIFKDHFDRKAATERTAKATPAPSSRGGAGTIPDFGSMSADEFRDYQNKVLNGR